MSNGKPPRLHQPELGFDRLSPIYAEDMDATACMPYQGDATLSTLGQSCVMLSYGKTPLAKLSKKSLAGFSVGTLFYLPDRPDNDYGIPEFVVVDQENRPKPYSLDTLSKSAKGMIDQPLVLCDFRETSNKKQDHVELDLPKNPFPHIVEGRLFGWINSKESKHPFDDRESIPPLTLIPCEQAVGKSVSLFILGQQCRFQGRVEIRSPNGRPRVTGMEEDSCMLRYIFPTEEVQILYPISTKKQSYSVPGISWDKLCSCTYPLPELSQGELF